MLEKQVAIADKEYLLSFTQEAKEIIGKMSLEEKVYLMSGNLAIEDMKEDSEKGLRYNEEPYEAGGNEHLGVPAMKFVDGPQGAVSGTGAGTCFSVSMARGATFDWHLEERIDKTIGKEIRAYGGNLLAVYD